MALKERLSSWWHRERGEDGGDRGPVVVDLAPREADDQGRRSLTLADLRDGLDEAVQTIADLRRHLEAQARHTAELAERLHGLPDALSALPESAKTQGTLLQTLREQAQRHADQAERLNHTLEGLTAAAGRQDETMQAVHGVLADDQGTRGKLLEGVVALRSTLEGVESSHLASRDALRTMQEQVAQRDEALTEMLRRARRQQAVTGALTLLVAVLALAGVAWVAWAQGWFNA